MLTVLLLLAGLRPTAATATPALDREGVATSTAGPSSSRRVRVEPKKRRGSSGPHFDVALDLELRGGDRTALSIRPGPIPFLQFDAAVEPNFGTRRWVVALPLLVAFRGTPGSELGESRGRVGLAGGWNLPKRLSLLAEVGVEGILRPNWPDLYQPNEEGQLAPTDRYSRWSRQARASASWRITRGVRLRFDYGYRLVVYEQDPNFDPLEAPTHLVPDDHQQHRAELEFAWDVRPFFVRLGATGWLRDDFFNFSRDAGTGVTHAGPGGAPPNPLQAYQGLSPALSLGIRAPQGGLHFRYAVAVVEDPFQGYYSSVTHSPRLNLWWRPGPGLKLRAGVEVNRRRFGPGSYQEGPRHPPLSEGTRRADQWVDLEAELSWSATSELELAVVVEHRSRETNFPDYVPGFFPRSRAYDITWDYDQTVGFLAVRYRFGAFRGRP